MRSYKGPGVQYSDPFHTGTPTAVEQIDDGRWHHKFSQSWMNTFDLCPERARLTHEGYRRETDAASVGTAVHSAIEYALEHHRDGLPLSFAEALDVAYMELDSMEFEYVKWSSPRGPRGFLEACFTAWWDTVLPTLPREFELEVPFCLPLIDDEERLVEVSGVIDYVGDMIRDWKTSSRGEFQEWEYRRWAIQPTVYTWAYDAMSDFEHSMIPFEYVVLGRHGVQRFTVERGPKEWAWMRDKALTMALMIEAQLEEWPKQDNHALCSAKWCDAWSVCKGRYE